jgi:hypothetical protein
MQRRKFITLLSGAAFAWSFMAASMLAVQASEIRFPKTGKYAFHLTLLKGWHSRMDIRGGLLLVPPSSNQHAMIYIAILVDDKYRGQPDSVIAGTVGKIAGIQTFDKQEPAQVSDSNGTTFHKGTAFYGKISANLGLARMTKLMIFRLEPNTWAELWIVAQPGLNAVEVDSLEQFLNGITLTSEQ